MLRTNEELIAMIREATARREGFNKTAQLLPLMGEIETSLASGMSRKALRDKLAQAGIDMPLAALDSILYRYRKKHGRPKKAVPVAQSNIINQAAPTNTLPVQAKPLYEPNKDGIPETSQERLRRIIRTPPDMAELERLGKEAIKKRKAREQKEREQKKLP